MQCSCNNDFWRAKIVFRVGLGLGGEVRGVPLLQVLLHLVLVACARALLLLLQAFRRRSDSTHLPRLAAPLLMGSLLCLRVAATVQLRRFRSLTNLLFCCIRRHNRLGLWLPKTAFDLLCYLLSWRSGGCVGSIELDA